MKNIFLFLFSFLFYEVVNAQPGQIEIPIICHGFTLIDNGKVIDSTSIYNGVTELDLKYFPNLLEKFKWYNPIYRFVSLPLDTLKSDGYYVYYDLLDSFSTGKRYPFCFPEGNSIIPQEISTFFIIKNGSDTMEIIYSNNEYAAYASHVDTIIFRKGRCTLADIIRRGNKHYGALGDGNTNVKINQFDDDADSIPNQVSTTQMDSIFNFKIKEADAFFNSKDYNYAISKYEDALRCRPENYFARARLGICNEAIMFNSNSDPIQSYKLFISKADKLLAEKDFLMAKIYYELANDEKPEQQYPKDQIILCDKYIGGKVK